MTVPSPQQTPEIDWRRFHAFGLPTGSIRALLAMMIFATAWGLLLLRPTQEIPDYLRDLLFVIMGHYFAVRNRSTTPAEVGPPPLYLPNGTVRVVLILLSLAVGVSLYVRGQLTTPAQHPGVVTLLLVGGFLLGVLANTAYRMIVAEGQRPARWLEDLRALVAMAAAVLLIALIANRIYVVIPQEQIDLFMKRLVNFGRFGPENLLAAVIGFYFGSRS